MARGWTLVALIAACAATPLLAGAQPAAKMARVALVHASAALADMQGPKPADELTARFVERLRGLGYVEGRTISIERRSAEGDRQRIPGLLKEVVELRVDVIVALGGAALAAPRATSTIPIVVATSDPVALGLTDSLTRPTKNVTGLAATAHSSLIGKSLQLLKEVAPKSRQVAMIDFKYVNAEVTPGTHLRRVAAEAAVRDLGLTIVPVGIDSPADVDRALAVIEKERVDALMAIDTPNTFQARRRIIDFALQRRLPTIFECRTCVEDGGLMSYADDSSDMPERLAGYVDRILNGAKPADLPFEDPTKFQLVINLKTAALLGLTIPNSLLIAAELVK